MSYKQEFKEEVRRMKREWMNIPSIKRFLDSEWRWISTDTIRRRTNDIEQNIMEDIVDNPRYEYDDENLYVYSSVIDQFWNKEKKRFEIPFSILNEIQKKYVSKWSNWSWQQVINNNWWTLGSPLYIDGKAWNAIKSALNLNKHSWICNEVFLKLLEDKHWEEETDQYIEETALSTTRQRHIDKELKALNRSREKVYNKALARFSNENKFLEEIWEAIKDWKPIDIKTRRPNFKSNKWRVYWASDFHFWVNTEKVSSNLINMSQYICEQDIDTAYIILWWDFYENLVPWWMHEWMERDCDMHWYDLVLYVVNAFEKALLDIYKSWKKVVVYWLRGNHDRIGKLHELDSERMWALVTYELIKRWLSNTDIEINVLEQDFNSTMIEWVNFITHHWDKRVSSKAQTKPEDILWKHWVTWIQNVIIYWDKHNIRINEALNADCIWLSAMCPQWAYAKKLDLHSREWFLELEMLNWYPSYRVIRV